MHRKFMSTNPKLHGGGNGDVGGKFVKKLLARN